MYVSYSPEEFDGLLNVTISDVMDIIHPERKNVVKELPSGNITSNSTYSHNSNNTNSKSSDSEEKKHNSDL